MPGGDRPMIYGAQGATPLGAPSAAKLSSFASPRKYDPDEPRVPAGSPEGGQWTDGGGTSDAAGEAANPQEPTQLAQAQTCRDFIAQNCKASILRVFPGQFLDKSIDDVLSAADQGDAAARTAKKLLSRKEYLK